jgi:hypothetical protein
MNESLHALLLLQIFLQTLLLIAKTALAILTPLLLHNHLIGLVFRQFSVRPADMWTLKSIAYSSFL